MYDFIKKRSYITCKTSKNVQKQHFWVHTTRHKISKISRIFEKKKYKKKKNITFFFFGVQNRNLGEFVPNMMTPKVEKLSIFEDFADFVHATECQKTQISCFSDFEGIFICRLMNF